MKKLILMSAFSLSALAAAGVDSCDNLAKLSLPNTFIATAKLIQTGSPEFKDLPTFCRVVAQIKPSKDSDIGIEVWMPASGWNGKFLGVGNGGWSGDIPRQAMGRELVRGYATAGTDTGHRGGGDDASFAYGHPEKLIDFAYRSVHEMTVQAKAIVTQFYGKPPTRSYWNGCSSGGKQGLMEAQRYPADYDGIVAGAPANYWTHLMAADIWPGQATLSDEASNISNEKFRLLHRAVIDACDTVDGLKDGLLQDPTRCHFDPGTLLCKGDDGQNCLTQPQIAAVRKIYAGPKNPRTGEQVFPGLEPGSEPAWPPLAGGPKPFGIVDSYFKYLVFNDPNWDFKTLNFDADIARSDKLNAAILNATDPNLKPFVAHAGKLLLYHGWADTLIAPRNTINYFNSVVGAMGGADKAADSVRLFMAPGMGHCFGGEGPFSFDAVSAMESWVEHGNAPDQIIASHLVAPGKADRTRPLCPYPQVSQYKGTGSIDDAQNFTCTIEK
jgi:feruloyl esterase